MTYETKMRKSHVSGWVAETYIELEKVDATKTRFLKVFTDKKSTTASAIVQEQQGQFVSERSAIFEDYFKRVALSGVSRSTEKAILTAHEKAMQEIQPHIEAAKAQYKIAA